MKPRDLIEIPLIKRDFHLLQFDPSETNMVLKEDELRIIQSNASYISSYQVNLSTGAESYSASYRPNIRKVIVNKEMVVVVSGDAICCKDFNLRDIAPSVEVGIINKIKVNGQKCLVFSARGIYLLDKKLRRLCKQFAISEDTLSAASFFATSNLFTKHFFSKKAQFLTFGFIDESPVVILEFEEQVLILKDDNVLYKGSLMPQYIIRNNCIYAFDGELSYEFDLNIQDFMLLDDSKNEILTSTISSTNPSNISPIISPNIPSAIAPLHSSSCFYRNVELVCLNNRIFIKSSADIKIEKLHVPCFRGVIGFVLMRESLLNSSESPERKPVDEYPLKREFLHFSSAISPFFQDKNFFDGYFASFFTEKSLIDLLKIEFHEVDLISEEYKFLLLDHLHQALALGDPHLKKRFMNLLYEIPSNEDYLFQTKEFNILPDFINKIDPLVFLERPIEYYSNKTRVIELLYYRLQDPPRKIGCSRIENTGDSTINAKMRVLVDWLFSSLESIQNYEIGADRRFAYQIYQNAHLNPSAVYRFLLNFKHLDWASIVSYEHKVGNILHVISDYVFVADQKFISKEYLLETSSR